jgi:glycosyltransferase involved in cell wall biosynthesis
MPRLSAIIIAQNEAHNIADCLASVAFCDERIVVDSGSTDDTVRIAKEAGARVAFNEWKGFGRQFNHALSLATGDWVLSIDADERVTPVLGEEILEAIKGADATGFEMPRLSSFCGKPIRHSGWYPDYVMRVFQREKGRWTDDLVHPHPYCDGPVERLKNPLIHHPILRLEDALRRMDQYSTAGAEMMLKRGRQVWFVTGLVHGTAAFLRTYVLQLGFLDGREGYLVAVYNAQSSYYKYMKVWLARRNEARAKK